jgi:hypothetical protein
VAKKDSMASGDPMRWGCNLSKCLKMSDTNKNGTFEKREMKSEKGSFWSVRRSRASSSDGEVETVSTVE